VTYAWIHQHRDSFPVVLLCEVFAVSKSGYYASIDRPMSPRARRHERIQVAVAQVHARSHGIYGSLKISQALAQQDELELACRNTVATAMRELGLKSRVTKSFTPTTTQADPTKQPAPNKLNRDFTAPAPNRKWVTDITYLLTAEGWVYLAVVLDLFSRKVVGWSLQRSLETTLVAEALRQAIESRRPAGKELLHHSDRGSQYTVSVRRSFQLPTSSLLISTPRWMSVSLDSPRHRTVLPGGPSCLRLRYPPSLATASR
jgi:putative transposase